MSRWNLWYDLSPSETVENNKTDLNSIDHGQYLIDNVQFFDISQSGAISCIASDVSTKMLINACIFSNCTRESKNGGAILFSGQGQIVQNKIFSEKCLHTGKYGHHAETIVTNSEKSKNYLISSTISNIFHEKYHHLLRILYGQIRLKSINISDCKFPWGTSYIIAFPSLSEVTLCNFVNLNSSRESLHFNGNINKLSLSNIININVSDTQFPVVYFIMSAGSYIAQNCAFCQNSQLLFKADANLVATISKCYICSSESFSYIGDIRLDENINKSNPALFDVIFCPIHVSSPSIQTCATNYRMYNYILIHVFILL